MAQVLTQRRYLAVSKADPDNLDFNPADPNFYDAQFYVHDRLGSVRLVVDGRGAVVNSYIYTPFGRFYDGEAPAETVENPFKFTGQWLDAEINQYYLRARMYDPAMMRFTSRDPVAGKQVEPLTLHKYLYCLNDPMDHIDLSGKNAMANALVAPVVAGHTAHVLAVTVVAYGVSTMDWGYIDLGITIDINIGKIMSMVALTATSPTTAIETILHEHRGRRKDAEAQDRAWYELVNQLDKRMSGDEPPEDSWWKKLLWAAGKLFDNYNTGSGT